MTYYIQTNIICISLLILVYTRLRNRRETLSSRRRVYLRLIWTTVFFCVSDAIASLCSGQMFPGARILIEASNIIYDLCLAWCAYLWLLFINMRLHDLEYNHKRFMYITAPPLLLFTLIACLNPVTHFLFTVTEDNIYHRGSLLFIHWIVSWGYLFAAESLVVVRILRMPTRSARKKLIPLLSFIVAPMIAALIQMFFYGVTTTQCGITFSIVLMTFSILQEKISLDTLTGLNNRSAMETFLSDKLSARRQKLTLFMCDVDHFKQINDTLGHLVGDLALKSVADVLKEACGKSDRPVFLCRYGGDEFIIVTPGDEDEATEILLRDIQTGLENFNKGSHNVFTLEMSIGSASGICGRYDDVETLIAGADGRMYSVKTGKKVQR